MAQVLKESQRINILNAAKKELLEKGYRDVSMRHIAAMAHMTVGNLYRYYQSKDALIQAIVSPAIQRIDDIVQTITQQRISLFTQSENVGLSIKDITKILDSLADDLVSLHREYRDEMMILMLNSEVKIKLEDWLAHLIQVVVTENRKFDDSVNHYASILSKMMAASIFSGMQEGFKLADQNKVNDTELEMIIRLYFNSSIKMIDFDESILGGC